MTSRPFRPAVSRCARRGAGVGVLALGFALTGCGPRVLDGSLSDSIVLEYTGVEAAASGSVETVRFTTPQGSGENIVFEVAAETAGITGFVPGTEVDLAELAPDGAQRGRISRNVFQEARHDFPAIARGHLTIHQKIVRKAPPLTVTGDFAVTFVECTVFACGRTVYGSFEALVP